MEKTIIPIFFTIDDNYSKLLQIALKSICLNSNKDFQYNIHILHSGLSDTNREDLSSYATSNINIVFINMYEKMQSIAEHLFVRDYYSKTTYYRLFIPKMFPELKKALYIDSDLVVLDDIANLYNIDIGTNLVGAVPDEAIQTVEEFNLYSEKYLGIPHEKYFNAGVLVMNLEELRKIDFESKFINLLKQIKFTVAQDQDYLNSICKGRVCILPSGWNKMPFPNEINEEDLKLVHYNLTLKPWHHDGILYEKYFYKYAEEANLLDYVKECKNNFTDEQRKADDICTENLKKMALGLTQIEDTFVNLVKSGKITF